ncbi:E3 ubiquitin-protein ligase rnf8-A-like [Ornithodoros turicata]
MAGHKDLAQRQQFDDHTGLPFTIVLQNEEEVIGRSSECSVNIRSVMVSRRHAVFRHVGEFWYVADDGSMNGVYINDRKLDPNKPHLLQHGDKVSLGPPLRTRFVFRFTLHDPETAAAQQGRRSTRAGTVANRAFLIMVLEQNMVTGAGEQSSSSPECEATVRVCGSLEEHSNVSSGEVSPKKVSCPKKLKLSQSDHVVTIVKDVLENELTCFICYELFVEAVILQCGHTFCNYCIQSWRRQRDICPFCQTKVLTQNRNFLADNVIEGLLSCTPTLKQPRERLLQERMEAL